MNLSEWLKNAKHALSEYQFERIDSRRHCKMSNAVAHDARRLRNALLNPFCPDFQQLEADQQDFNTASTSST